MKAVVTAFAYLCALGFANADYELPFHKISHQDLLEKKGKGFVECGEANVPNEGFVNCHLYYGFADDFQITNVCGNSLELCQQCFEADEDKESEGTKSREYICMLD